MADETLNQYINRLKSEHAERTRQHKSTLSFFLKEIRELADQAMPDKEGQDTQEKLLESSVAAEKAAVAGQQITPGRARSQVANTFAIETNSTFTKNYLGKMLFFQYDAKHKKTLPYWDKYPIAFLISTEGNSGLGINLHYLPPVERAKLLYNLMTLANTDKLDPQTKLLYTYKLLANSAKFREFKPCIKRYLFGHIRSRVMVIDATKWTEVVFLPLAEFQKMDEYQVWQDSIAKIRKDNSPRHQGQN